MIDVKESFSDGSHYWRFAIIWSLFYLTRIGQQKIDLRSNHLNVKKLCVLWMFIALAAFASCHRQQAEEQKNAEIYDRVRLPVTPGRQAQEQQQLAQHEAELNAREKVPAVIMTPASSASPSASVENRHALKSQAQKFRPRLIVPMTSPSIETPTATPKTTPSVQ